MPADDLILNLRQIAAYPASGDPDAQLIAQSGGLGGPYVTMTPAQVIDAAFASPVSTNWQINGSMFVAGDLTAVNIGAQNASIRALDINQGTAAAFDADNLSVAGTPVATTVDVAALASTTVRSFNMRRGDVCLELDDVLCAGGAPNNSPRFEGTPRAPTPGSRSNSNRIATTKFVQFVSRLAQEQWAAETPLVNTFNGRVGCVELTEADVLQALGVTEIGQLVTEQFVADAISANNQTLAGIYAPLASPQFTGDPTGPTAPVGTSSGQLATTAFVMNAVAAATAGVSAFNGRTGDVTLNSTDIAAADGALLVSPAFGGTPTAPTAAVGTNTTQLATTAFVNATLGSIVQSFNGRTGAITLTGQDIISAGGAPLDSPGLTGVPLTPTAAAGTSTTQIASCAFVMAALAAAGAVQSFNGRTGAVTLLGNDVSAAGGALLAGPTFTGTPSAPTAPGGTATTQIATTAFVAQALAAGAVQSFNGRSGVVTLQASDITGAGGAPLNSPALTGTPTAPTATAGTASGQLATTQFVANALAAFGAGVLSFNTRTGAVTLTGTDIAGAGGALLASPAFTGSPTAPTASAGTSNTQIATTAFVQAAVATATSGVSSFNSRTGAVTLQAADLSAVGGALLASPAFTGTPSGPTAAAGTSTTQLATTAFVQAALTSFGGVTTFNGRAGAVTLTLADITGAGGAPNASPSFSGVPQAPTAAVGTSTPQIATTAFCFAGFLPFSGGNLTGPLSSNSTIGGVSISGGNVSIPGNLGVTGTIGGVSIAGGNVSVPNNVGVGAALTASVQVVTPSVQPISGDNTGTIGFPGSAWSQVVSYAFAQQSDARLKTKIDRTPVPVLDKLAALTPARFNWKTGDARRHWGFVAQDVRDALGADFGGYIAHEGHDGISLVELVAVLWRGVQQLAERVEQLEGRPA
jgi:hypothetical protein